MAMAAEKSAAGQFVVHTPAPITSTRRKHVLEEIAKCDLICSNCHRIRTTMRVRAALQKELVGNMVLMAGLMRVRLGVCV